MNSIELVQKIWDKVYNPNSCVPDIEIGHVREILAQVLAETLVGSEGLDSEVDRYVLSSILVGPVTGMDLDFQWFDIKYRKYLPPPEDGNYESRAYKKASRDHYKEQDRLEQVAFREITGAIERLQEKGLIEVKGDPENESRKVLYPKSSGTVVPANITRFFPSLGLLFVLST